MATYVVGDIQGCYDGLCKLLDKVRFEPGIDKLWAVGDLIGRGPDALQTLGFLYGLEDSFSTVLGNHDLHFLAVYAGIKAPKAADKFDQLLGSAKCRQYADWLRAQPLAVWINKQTFLSHAGLYPLWTPDQAIALSKEVGDMLNGPNWKTLLAQMYGSEPQAWQEGLQGKERLIFIINALTRMRYVDKDGRLDLKVKSPPAEAPINLIPWFAHPALPLCSPLKVLFGHWASLEGNSSNPHCIALDTGYIWGGALTALHLESGDRIQIKGFQ
ncbi:symmetrical bis(5'-nucleosyl)-tetraphosphatase [Aliiglaciecola sp. CAU 1673]|uniref:symmetrical bis(5'-nucleosyl)-tetraphosphatase n=1 Tax=Aliiglaciecola sp. CAU 1673 TaxID=3032595 RepID=UPI0023DBD4E1|nr:symmetrical bis(5'-nucleosyl)-tetraphosphatase [Aliiglaciecola sp. CAU 1673]MDF2176776.1 symmetrical bis(5'-nucleosyl)-tetraphosphatase [Aliiglaciecola sp. CAU 1673]